jgi:prepilin-type N-terminal cleavage/methylation domain-containing protein
MDTTNRSRTLPGWRRLLSPSARRRDDGGFSLIEVTIAIGLFAIIAAFMSQELAGGLRGVLRGKRREIATQDANRVLEVARSLSYGAVGLASTDATIGTCGSPADSALSCVNNKLSYAISGGTTEPLIWATNPSGHPFNPHIQQVTRSSTKLTRYIYVTGVDSDGNATIDMKRVLVRVRWDDTGSEGPKNEVRAQTLISPSGALPGGPPGSSSTPLTAATFATGGTLELKSALLGLSTPLEISLPTSTGKSKFRAVSDVNCTTKSASMNILDTLDIPGQSVTVTADDDSRTNTPSNPSPQSKQGVLSLSGVPASLLGASVTSPIACEADVDDYGHELGTGSPLAGTLNAATNVSGLLGTLTLASMSTLPVTQQIDNELVVDQREVHGQAAAAAGMINVLKLPNLGIEHGLVRIDALNYGVDVRAADGTPSTSPSVTSPTISLRIYDNANKIPGCTSRSGGYCILTVDPAAAGFNGITYSVTHNFTQLVSLSLVSVEYTTSVSILPPVKTPIAGETGPNGETRWSAEYTPVSLAASLDVSLAGIPLVDTDVEMNVGTVRAEACAGTTCL